MRLIFASTLLVRIFWNSGDAFVNLCYSSAWLLCQIWYISCMYSERHHNSYQNYWHVKEMHLCAMVTIEHNICIHGYHKIVWHKYVPEYSCTQYITCGVLAYQVELGTYMCQGKAHHMYYAALTSICVPQYCYKSGTCMCHLSLCGARGLESSTRFSLAV
jgi:hypothetical protein